MSRASGPVMGSELDVQAEPCVAARGGDGRGDCWGFRICFFGGYGRDRILVGDVADGWQCIANGPGRVIVGGRRCGEVRCNADAPVFVEEDGRAYAGGVEDGGRDWRSRVPGLGVAVGFG